MNWSVRKLLNPIRKPGVLFVILNLFTIWTQTKTYGTYGLTLSTPPWMHISKSNALWNSETHASNHIPWMGLSGLRQIEVCRTYEKSAACEKKFSFRKSNSLFLCPSDFTLKTITIFFNGTKDYFVSPLWNISNMQKGWLPSAKLKPTFTFLGRDFAIFNTLSWQSWF